MHSHQIELFMFYRFHDIEKLITFLLRHFSVDILSIL